MARTRTDAPTAGTGVTRYVVASLVVAVLAVVLAVRNSERVEVDLLVWSGEAPLYALAAIAALVGAVLTALLTAVWRHRRIALNRERRAAIDLREQRVADPRPSNEQLSSSPPPAPPSP